MRIELSFSDQVTPAVDAETREHVRRTLLLAFSRFRHRIRAVRVRLDPVAGSSSGSSGFAHECRISIHASQPPTPPIVIAETDPAGIREAFTRASSRAVRAVSRQFNLDQF